MKDKINSILPISNFLQTSSKKYAIFISLFLILMGVFLVSLSAKIHIPMYPVPFTMQTVAVLLVGGLYGARLGSVTLLCYFIFGVLGVPIFSSVSGMAILASPTLGYLIGFIIAAYMAGWIAERRHMGYHKILLGLLGASSVIMFLGWAWLAFLIGFGPAFLLGVLPFLLGDFLKLCFVMAVFRVLWGSSFLEK